MTPQFSASQLTPHKTAICRVTYRMTDQMGVVYYGNYLELFEIGRTELLRATGMDYRMMERDGFFLPVIHAECDYRTPARYDDLLIIRTAVTRLSRVRLDFQYEVVRQEKAEADEAVRAIRICTGATHHAITDAAGRPRRLTPQWLEQLEAATAHL